MIAQAMVVPESLLNICTQITGGVGVSVTAYQRFVKVFKLGGNPCTLFTAMVGEVFALVQKYAPALVVGLHINPVEVAAVDAAIGVGCAIAGLLIPGAGELEAFDLILLEVVEICDLISIGQHKYKVQASCCNNVCTTTFCNQYFASCLQASGEPSCV